MYFICQIRGLSSNTIPFKNLADCHSVFIGQTPQANSRNVDLTKSWSLDGGRIWLGNCGVSTVNWCSAHPLASRVVSASGQ